MMFRRLVFSVAILLLSSGFLVAQEGRTLISWENRASLPTDLGINGAFIGQHNGVILIAGGANFPNKPVWEGGQKQWYNTIYALSKDGKGNWEVISSVQKLPKPLAYGVAVSTLHGVLCVGGESVDGFSNACIFVEMGF